MGPAILEHLQRKVATLTIGCMLLQLFHTFLKQPMVDVAALYWRCSNVTAALLKNLLSENLH